MILSAGLVSKSYGKHKVLNEVSLTCQGGEICGLIGPNGAGKSTLFRILTGLVAQDSGTLEIRSESPKPIGAIIEKPAIYGYLSAYENLRVFSRIQGLCLTKDQCHDLIGQVGLSPDRKDPVRNYSMGMKQRLGLAIALLNDPDFLILDEPFSGLDPIGIHDLQEQVRTLIDQRSIGVLISSHNLVELGDLCDRLYVINKGEIIRQGPARKILQAAAQGYILHGKGLENSRILSSLRVKYMKDSIMLFPENQSIEEIIRILAMEEGVSLTACIPQTHLPTLFEKNFQ